MSTQVPIFRSAQYNWLNIHPSCGGIGSYIMTAGYICSLTACHTTCFAGLIFYYIIPGGSQFWSPGRGSPTSLTQVWTYIIYVFCVTEDFTYPHGLSLPHLKISFLSPSVFLSSSHAVPRSSSVYLKTIISAKTNKPTFQNSTLCYSKSNCFGLTFISHHHFPDGVKSSIN